MKIFNFSALKTIFKKYDFSFLGIGVSIFIIGILNLYSALHSSTDASMSNLYRVQIFYFSLSILIGLLVSFINPKNLFRYSNLLYFINIFALILVLVLGHKGMGARRWLVIGPLRFQPSELMKISLVLSLGRYFTKYLPEREIGLRDLIIPGLITFFPAILIFLEPDLGTGGLLVLIFLVICFYRKLKWRSILVLSVIGLISGSLLYQFGLKNYQKKRILTFLNPNQDARGSGYNAIQSKIAIGSGQFFGKGFKKSSQASLSYLPENHTDFVFSIFNEEHGLFGSVVLIALYLILFVRLVMLATSLTKIYESIVSIGILSIFFWHTFINMAMVTGLFPIVGLPLPFMSYGGSSLLTFGICLGIASSISNSKNLF